MSCGAVSPAPGRAHLGRVPVMGLLNNAIPFGLMAWGQQFIETGLTSIFNAATAVFGVLVAAMVFADERLTPRRLARCPAGLRGRGGGHRLDALARLRHPVRRATGGAGGRAVLRVRRGLGAGEAVASAARDRGGGDAQRLEPDSGAAGPADRRRASVPPRRSRFGAIAYFSILGTAVAYLLYYRSWPRPGPATR
jgi:hypothetical protein